MLRHQPTPLFPYHIRLGTDLPKDRHTSPNPLHEPPGDQQETEETKEHKITIHSSDAAANAARLL